MYLLHPDLPKKIHLSANAEMQTLHPDFISLMQRNKETIARVEIDHSTTFERALFFLSFFPTAQSLMEKRNSILEPKNEEEERLRDYNLDVARVFPIHITLPRSSFTVQPTLLAEFFVTDGVQLVCSLPKSLIPPYFIDGVHALSEQFNTHQKDLNIEETIVKDLPVALFVEKWIQQGKRTTTIQDIVDNSLRACMLSKLLHIDGKNSFVRLSIHIPTETIQQIALHININMRFGINISSLNPEDQDEEIAKRTLFKELIDSTTDPLAKLRKSTHQLLRMPSGVIQETKPQLHPGGDVTGVFITLARRASKELPEDDEQQEES